MAGNTDDDYEYDNYYYDDEDGLGPFEDHVGELLDDP
jgi:hypothetical protein